jgi:hypothetical protein
LMTWTGSYRAPCPRLLPWPGYRAGNAYLHRRLLEILSGDANLIVAWLAPNSPNSGDSDGHFRGPAVETVLGGSADMMAAITSLSSVSMSMPDESLGGWAADDADASSRPYLNFPFRRQPFGVFLAPVRLADPLAAGAARRPIGARHDGNGSIAALDKRRHSAGCAVQKHDLAPGRTARRD